MDNCQILLRERHESARSWSYRILLHNIVRLRFAPGSCLVESELRKMLNVSRTPIREAIMQLAQENFLEIIPQKGTYVSRIDMGQVLELRYIRRCVEVDITRNACPRLTQADMTTLCNNMERQMQVVAHSDVEGFLELDDAMHSVIYAAAGRSGVWDFFRRNSLQHYRSRVLGLRMGRALTNVIGEHTALIDALGARDAEKAAKAAHTHLDEGTWNLDRVRELYPEYIQFPEDARRFNA